MGKNIMTLPEKTKMVNNFQLDVEKLFLPVDKIIKNYLVYQEKWNLQKILFTILQQ
jgi:hypothetical protein